MMQDAPSMLSPVSLQGAICSDNGKQQQNCFSPLSLLGAICSDTGNIKKHVINLT
jgi:hypothetical protein